MSTSASVCVGLLGLVAVGNRTMGSVWHQVQETVAEDKASYIERNFCNLLANLLHSEPLFLQELSLKWALVYLLELGGKDAGRRISYFLWDTDCTLSIPHGGDTERGKNEEGEAAERRRAPPSSSSSCGWPVPWLKLPSMPRWLIYHGLFYYLFVIYFVTCLPFKSKWFFPHVLLPQKQLCLWFQAQTMSSYEGGTLNLS